MFLLFLCFYIVFRLVCFGQHTAAEHVAVRAWERACRKARAREARQYAEWVAYRNEFHSTRRARQRAEAEHHRAEADAAIRSHLRTLGLSVIPSSPEALGNARRAAIFKNHPDRGGDAEAIHAIEYAYSKLFDVLKTRRVVG